MLVCSCVGVSGLYRGVTATILKQGSNQAIRFFVIESLKEAYKGEDKRKQVPTLLTGLFGATAGAASVFGNTPLDVIKTRMQVRPFPARPGPGPSPLALAPAPALLPSGRFPFAVYVTLAPLAHVTALEANVTAH